MTNKKSNYNYGRILLLGFEMTIRLFLLGGDGEIEGYGLGDLDAGGRGGGDLILVGAGWGVAEVGVGVVA